MLATPGDLPVGPEWVYEVEWDGLRVLAEVVDGGLRLITLEGQDVTPCFPELAGLTHLVPDVVLDGTVVLLTRGLPDADALAARLRGVPPGPHATLMLSDILRLYGVELHNRPQDERRATLERLDLGRVPGVVLSPVYTDGPALRAAAVARGLPGVLAKRRDAPYRAGPTTTWVRVDGADPDGGGRATAGRAGLTMPEQRGARPPEPRGRA
jgi:bifunctional non-homologous end joining protein LigD